MVRTGVTRSFGAELRRLLALSAKSRLTAFASGLAVTGALQSGTATTLIITSFAAQGLVTGAAALAIILGADVGTTIVVQLLSFGLHWLSPLLIAAGVFGFLSVRRSRHKNLARITRSEEHTSELQSLMRISYAVFCLKKKKKPYVNYN